MKTPLDVLQSIDAKFRSKPSGNDPVKDTDTFMYVFTGKELKDLRAAIANAKAGAA